MNRGKEPLVSLCERRFVLEAIKDKKRLDGRGEYDYRSLRISPSAQQPGSVEVTLGNTRVLANVSCQVVRPRPQRPTEGELVFNVELSPMASPRFEVGRLSPLATEIARMLERCLKESRAIDTESLCLIAGEKVWSVRVDVHVLDHCGNITDCATVAAITALKHFRRPDVTVIGEEATIHPVTERDPVPLSVHHMPFCVSFAFFANGECMLVDPSLTEEVVMEGRLVVGMNTHREICVLGMAGGVAILPHQLLLCTQIAGVKCQELTDAVKAALSVTSTHNKECKSIMETGRGVEEVMVTGEGGRGGEEKERSESVEMVEEEEDEEVMYLGEGTAEVGLGGRSQWRVDSGGEGVGESCVADKDAAADADDVIVVESSDDVRGGNCVEAGDKKGESSSEEECVVVLTEQDIGGFARQPAAVGGVRGEGRRGKRGGRGGGRTAVAETAAGRGRQGKKKKKKKKT